MLGDQTPGITLRTHARIESSDDLLLDCELLPSLTLCDVALLIFNLCLVGEAVGNGIRPYDLNPSSIFRIFRQSQISFVYV